MRKPRRGFRHWLGDQSLPQPLSEDKLLRYYHFLRHAKTETVKKQAAHKLVMCHVRLGMAAVARWTLTYPHRTDEMVSEMLDALVDGVKMISEGALDRHETPQIAGYLTQTVYGRINKMLRRDKFAYALYISGKYSTGKGKIDVGSQEFVKTKGYRLTRLEKALTTKGEQESRDIQEIIRRSIQTDQERTVIELRVAGYDDTEIGEMMEPPVTKGRVHQIRTAVKRRIQEQLA